MIEKINLTMLTDFYELTMANGYFEANMKDDIAYFDMFFRKIPDDGGYAIMAGLEQVIEYLDNLEFTDEDIEYLRGKGIFSEEFLDYLKNFKFSCDVWAVPEGTPIFPYEPLITVRGPVMQAQFVETMILLLVNPHYDIYYYGGIVVLYLFILYTLIQLIREYNLMTTRPLPQLDRQGGDTSAPV